MSVRSNNLRLIIVIRDHLHFEEMNDFVAFHRYQIKDFLWYHSGFDIEEESTLTIEFHHPNDAMLFKLKYG